VARRSIGFPLTIGIVLSLLAIALLVAWQILVVSDLRPVAQGLTAVSWLLLILGTLFFSLIILGLGLLCAWLIREMRHNQRQQAFLDAVTHEMKTPLASLRLYVDTLSLHDPSPAQRQEFLTRMGDDVERLDRTVSQVLAAARAEEHPRDVRRASVELAPLLERCVQEIQTRHRLPDAAVRLEPVPRLGVRGDAGELALVFRNLLENAVKYSEPPIEVRVAVTAGADGRVHVEIADRGIGIPRDELRKIFQRFYRAGRDVQRTAGLGLGLFIVRNLVRRQGGRVVARSEGSGRGSRFVVSLRSAALRGSAEAGARRGAAVAQH
jgi:signal transduction histidine kinase